MATKSKALGKATLLEAVASANLLKPEPVTIDELNAVVLTRKMSIDDMEEYFEAMKEVEGTGNAEAFIRAAVDENGEALFSDTEEDLATVRSLPPSIVKAVLAKFNEINYLTRTQPKQEDEIKKNS